LGTGRYTVGSAVVKCGTEDGFGSGKAQITLLPTLPWWEIFFANDWISVYFSTGNDSPIGFGVVGQPNSPEDNDRVLFGFIDSVRKTVVVDKDSGETSVRCEIACSGFIKAFQRSSVYYNEMLGPKTLFGAMMPGLSTLTKHVPLSGTPTTLARAIALTYLGYAGQFVMPDNYPTGLDTRGDRDARLQDFLELGLKLEEQAGIHNVRLGQPGPQRGSILQSIQRKHKGEVPSNSLSSVMDFFSRVEDPYVDGMVQNSPTTDLTGSVWRMMMSNVNPIMNEMFVSLARSRLPALQFAKDEWGQGPAYTPTLFIREKPFSWVDNVFQLPSKKKGASRNIRYGNIFFSSPEQPASVPRLQIHGLGDEIFRDVSSFLKQEQGNDFSAEGLSNLGERLAGVTSAYGGFSGSRYIDRVEIRPSDIISESLGTSDNDTFNFWTISQSAMPMQHEKYVLLLDGLIPLFTHESIRRHGLRVNELATKFMFTGDAKMDSNAAFDFLVRTIMAHDLWYQHQPYYLAGQIVIPGMPKARPGMALDILSPRNETFYIEGVAHEWHHPGIMVTTLTVTRGQPSGWENPKLRFDYAPPDSVKVFQSDGSTPVARTKKKEQPLVDRKVWNPRKKGDIVQVLLLAEQSGGTVFRSISTVLPTIEKGIEEAQSKGVDPLGHLVFLQYITRGEAVKARAIFGETIPSEPRIPVMEDRAKAGKPPWIDQEDTVGSMWDPYRRAETILPNPGIALQEEINKIK